MTTCFHASPKLLPVKNLIYFSSGYADFYESPIYICTPRIAFFLAFPFDFFSFSLFSLFFFFIFTTFFFVSLLRMTEIAQPNSIDENLYSAPVVAPSASTLPGTGIANLPNQRHKIVAKNGANFTIMVCGKTYKKVRIFIDTLRSILIIFSR